MIFSPEDLAETGIVPAGTTVEFRCNWKYRLNGLPTHRCDNSGAWTYTAEPTCTGKYFIKTATRVNKTFLRNFRPGKAQFVLLSYTDYPNNYYLPYINYT